jgi:iron complex transport system permease protein
VHADQSETGTTPVTQDYEPAYICNIPRRNLCPAPCSQQL